MDQRRHGRNEAACTLLGEQFTPVLEVPDGDTGLGRRWVAEVVTVAWRIYRSVDSVLAGHSMIPGRKLSPITRIREA